MHTYVEFLRHESKLGDTPPIELPLIYKRFGIPIPQRVPLADEQQGILVDSSSGLILINENDSTERQRFTEGHELMELLFVALQRSSYASSTPTWIWECKEKLCDWGAAELLMPRASFITWLHQFGISLDTGQSLANIYKTSLVATLIRMVQLSFDNQALVMWRYTFKSSKLRDLGNQVSNYEPKLRIWWSSQSGTWSGGYIPKNKSISNTSLIARTYLTGESLSGNETIFLGKRAINCQIAAMPLQLGNENCVVSLLSL